MRLNAWCNTPKDEQSFRLMVSLFALHKAYLFAKRLKFDNSNFKKIFESLFEILN
jgi:hypothetical protein